MIAGSAATLAACGSSSSKSSSTTTTTPSTCTALQKLQSSVDALKSINVAQQGTDGVKSALDDVKQAAEGVKQSASKEFSSDVDALQQAIQTFGDDVSNGKGSQSVVDYIDKLGNDISAIGNAFDRLSSSAKTQLSNCDLKSN